MGNKPYYSPHNYPALFEKIGDSNRFLAEEIRVLDVLENMLNSLVKTCTERLSLGGRYGSAWINRFDVMFEKGQRFFLIMYSPRPADNMQGIQGPIGKGDFIGKKIYFYGMDNHHVGKVLIPKLKQLFADMDFEISKESPY